MLYGPYIKTCTCTWTVILRQGVCIALVLSSFAELQSNDRQWRLWCFSGELLEFLIADCSRRVVLVPSRKKEEERQGPEQQQLKTDEGWEDYGWVREAFSVWVKNRRGCFRLFLVRGRCSFVVWKKVRSIIERWTHWTRSSFFRCPQVRQTRSTSATTHSFQAHCKQ